MSRAFRYLARELAKSYVLISIALLVLFDLLAFLTESQDIGDANYTLLDALLVVTYSTPVLLVDLSPFVALLATLHAYDRLNATSELIALRAAGVSGLRLSQVVAGVAAVFMIGIASVEIVARPLRLEASLLRIHETTPNGNLLRRSGFWIRTGGTYVNVAELQDSGGPGGIRIYGFNDDVRLASYLRASSAGVVDANKWHLENVWRKAYSETGAPAAPETYAEFDWKPTWDPSTRLYELPVASFTLAELRSRVASRPNDSAGAQADLSELWRRLSLPLAAIAYALLATPFAMLANIRGGRSTRLAIGVALAFVVYIGQQVVSNAGILAGLSISVTSVVPPVLVLIFAVLLMRRLD
jgi:lipopolysaccharide export system permease protein